MADFIKRSEVFTYIDVGTGYELFDAGVMELNDELNPNVVSEGYIMDTVASSSLENYEPSFTFTMRNSKTDPVATYLRGLGKDLAVGTAAETTIVRFDGWEQDIDGTVAAKEYAVSIALDYTDNGPALERTEMSGTLHVQGDPIDGVFDTTTDTFTATVVS